MGIPYSNYGKHQVFTSIWEGLCSYEEGKPLVLNGIPNEAINILQTKLNKITLEAMKVSPHYKPELHAPFLDEADKQLDKLALSNARVIGQFIQHIAPGVSPLLFKHEADTRFKPIGPILEPVLYKVVLSTDEYKLRRKSNPEDAANFRNTVINAIVEYAFEQRHFSTFIDKQFESVTDATENLRLTPPGTVSITQKVKELRAQIDGVLKNTSLEAADRLEKISKFLDTSLKGTPKQLFPAMNAVRNFLDSFRFNSAATTPKEGFSGKDFFFMHMEDLWENWQPGAVPSKPMGGPPT